MKFYAHVLIGLIGLLTVGDAEVKLRCMCSAVQVASNDMSSDVGAATAEPLSIAETSPVDEPDQEPAWCIGSGDPRCNPRHAPEEAPQMNGGTTAFTLAQVMVLPPNRDTPRITAERRPRSGVRSRVDRPPQI